MTSELRVPVYDGFYQLIDEDRNLELDLANVAFESDRGIEVHPGVAFVYPLGGEETEFVTVLTDLLPERPSTDATDGERGSDFHIDVETNLEVRSSEGTRFVLVISAPGSYSGRLWRQPAQGDMLETHRLVFWRE